MGVAGTAFLAGHVHLEIGVPGGRDFKPLAGQCREEGAAEIRVENHAGGVDHPDEGERTALGEARDHTLGEGIGGGRGRRAFEDTSSLGGEHFADRLGKTAARDAGERRVRFHAGDEGVHPGKRPQQRRHLIPPGQARSPRARAPGR